MLCVGYFMEFSVLNCTTFILKLCGIHGSYYFRLVLIFFVGRACKDYDDSCFNLNIFRPIMSKVYFHQTPQKWNKSDEFFVNAYCFLWKKDKKISVVWSHVNVQIIL